ncbi:hypothetical protein F5887DRAFT_1074303 [Amanita rubescens]|nr:hypothetical protein F5887DRAFT_1074303 [Amanita rubescens]
MASSSKSTTSVLAIAGITVATSLLAYIVYFDYKRRNDAVFRKKLRKDKKRVDKAVAESKTSAGPSESNDISPEKLRDALEQLKNEESPKTPDEKEAYFMQQVSIGEQLAAQGNVAPIIQRHPEPHSRFQGQSFHFTAALSFFRALRVYPSPVELIMIYQKTVPEPVFKLIMELTNQNVKAQVEGYYNYFPPKWMNVSVESRSGPESQSTRSVLVLNKDVKAGDMIYKEYPIVTALDADLEAVGRYCSQCLRSLDASSIVRPGSSNPLGSSYCSHTCLATAKNQYYTLLFTLDAPLPPEIPAGPIPASALETRKNAQASFVEHIKNSDRASPLLVAKFIARQVAIETNKMVQKHQISHADGGEYLLADHIERLRYLELVPDANGMKHLAQVLESGLPGLEQFVTEERHATLLGKMAYNAYGVYFDGGRDDKTLKGSRTPVGTQRQIGTAVYTLSSYLTHSCTPNARVSFSSGTAQICLTAERDLKKGDELTIAFVDITQHEGETALECRRRRRIELARGWRFACSCSRCEEELPASGPGASGSGGSGSGMGSGPGSAAAGEESATTTEKKPEEDVGSDLKDESKVDVSVSRFEEAQRLEKEETR